MVGNSGGLHIYIYVHILACIPIPVYRHIYVIYHRNIHIYIYTCIHVQKLAIWGIGLFRQPQPRTHKLWIHCHQSVGHRSRPTAFQSPGCSPRRPCLIAANLEYPPSNHSNHIGTLSLCLVSLIARRILMPVEPLNHVFGIPARGWSRARLSRTNLLEDNC